MAGTAAPAAPSARGAPRFLRATALLLLLLLLGACCRRAAAAPVVSEMRCQCLQTTQGIHRKNIDTVQVKAAGPHCAQTQVLAILKSGQQVCLNPAAPMVKRIIENMLKQGSTN